MTSSKLQEAARAVVATVRVGYVVQETEGECRRWQVVGSRKIRKTYWYILRRPLGECSMRRDDLLEAQANGSLVVTL